MTASPAPSGVKRLTTFCAHWSSFMALGSVWLSLAIHAGLAGLYVLPTRSRP